MIAIRFGRWSSSSGSWFRWERIYWKGWRWTPFVWVSWRYPRGRLAKHNAQMLSGLQAMLDPVRGHDRKLLWEKVGHLKQSDGEGWAVGEMLERACILFDAGEAMPS